MDTDVLFELGLSKNEVEVYLKMLRMGSSTGFAISKETKLHRANVYDALERLVTRGMATHCVINGAKHYKAVDPEQFLEILRYKEAELKKIIPQMKALQGVGNPAANVEVFEGASGVRYTLEDILNNTKKEFFALGIPSELPILIGESWLRKWHVERIGKKLWFYHIVNEDYHVDRIRLLRRIKYTTIKFLPKQYSAPNAVNIYDKGVIFIFTEPLVAIRIINDDIAKSFRQYFMMLDKLALKKAPQEES